MSDECDKREREAIRQRIIKRCRYIVHECEQAIRDSEFWNGMPQNKQQTPIDVESFRVNRAWALKTLKEFGETI